MLEEVVEVAQHSTETLFHTGRTSSRRGWQCVLRFAKTCSRGSVLLARRTARPCTTTASVIGTIAEPSSNCEELQLLLSDVFWVCVCLFHSRTPQLVMNILEVITALPNSVFMLHCWSFSPWLLHQRDHLQRQASSCFFLWWCFICWRWHVDVCKFFLEMTPPPLNDRTHVERAKLHPSFQKLGIDSVYKWANRSAYHAKLLQPIGVPTYRNSFPEGCLARGRSRLSLSALFSRAA